MTFFNKSWPKLIQENEIKLSSTQGNGNSQKQASSEFQSKSNQSFENVVRETSRFNRLTSYQDEASNDRLNGTPNDRIDDASNELHKSGSHTHKRSASSSAKRTNKFDLEKEIELAESRLDQSKASLKRSLNKKTDKRESTNNSLKLVKKTSRSKEQRACVAKTNYTESQALTRQIMKLKTEYSELQQQYANEKGKTVKLNDEIQALTKKFKKLQMSVDKSLQLESDYEKLY